MPTAINTDLAVGQLRLHAELACRDRTALVLLRGDQEISQVVFGSLIETKNYFLLASLDKEASRFFCFFSRIKKRSVCLEDNIRTHNHQNNSVTLGARTER